MTIYEALFGTPERAAKAIEECVLNQLDFCYLMDAFDVDQNEKCNRCIYEFDRYGCERKDTTLLEWLGQEVVG